MYLFLVLLCFCLLWFLFCFLFFFRHRDGCIGPCKGPPTVRPLLVHLFTKMTEFSTALINGQHAACNSVLIDLAKAKRRWTEKKSTQLFSTWMFVSSCGLMVSSELCGSSWVRSEHHAATPRTGLPHAPVDSARPFLVLPAIKIEIENCLEMVLSKAKSGSAWQSHFWQCGTLRPARSTKLFTLRK